MFSNFTISLLFGIGFGGWIYGKTYHSNGGLTKRALTAAVVAGIAAFIVLVTLLNLFLH